MKKSLFNKIFIYISVIFLIAIVGFGIFSCIDNIQRTVKLTRNITKSASQIASQIAGEYDIDELIENPDSKDYQDIKSTLRSICKGDGLEYVYIYIPDINSNKVRYVVAVASDDKKNDRITVERGAGKIVEYEISDAEKNAWNGKTEGISYEYSSADYGKFMSSYALVSDKNNDCTALVGADYSLDKIYNEIISETVFKMSIVIVMLICIFGVTALFIKKKIYNPITFLFEHMKNYISNKTDDKKSFKPIKLNTNDEIQRMADFFNEMVVDIDNYVDRIKDLAGERAKAGTELEVARRIQYGIIEKKKDICLADDFVISAMMKSAKQVGGDFYDSFLLKNGDVCVLIGDVSGKGIAAALFMVFVKTLIREKLIDISDAAEAIRAANFEICRSNPEGMFVTAFVAVFEQNSDKFKYVNAGHNKPVIIHKGKAKFIECPACTALGVFDDSEYEQCENKFSDGDILYLYTDGITEAVNADKIFFGNDKLVSACCSSENTANGICVGVGNSLKSFIGNAEQFDDITMLAVERRDRYLKLSCNLSELKKIKKYIFDFDCDNGLKKKIFLACDEIFSNIINYSGADYVLVRCNKVKNNISIIFTDNGKSFNPLENKTEKEFEDFDEGGMGIMLIKKLCSSIEHNYTDGKNILTLEFINNKND